MSDAGERVDGSAILVEVARELGATRDVEGLLQRVVERATALFSAERALCALFDDAGQVHHVVTHNMTWAGRGSPLPVSQSVLAKVLTEDTPVLVLDPFAADDVDTFASVRLHGLRLVAAAPLHVLGRVKGVLYVDSQVSPRTDVEQKRDQFEALSRLVGTAVENAELFAEQGFRAELLAHVVHHLRTPLGVVLANADMLEEDGAAGPDTPAMLRDIRASAGRMVRIINTTLELGRVDAGAPQPRPAAVNLERYLEEQLRALGVVARKAGVTMGLTAAPGLPPACTIEDELGIVLDNLVFNAIKHAPAGTAVDVTLALRPSQEPPDSADHVAPRRDFLFRRAPALSALPGTAMLEVTVGNRGRAIDADVLPHLFLPYARGDKAMRGFKSTGIGLSIVAQCVHHLGGRAWIRSDAQHGTRVSFTLPTEIAPQPPAPSSKSGSRAAVSSRTPA